MAVYLVGGKLGSGKSLVAVGVMRDALRAGKKVATNLDLYLEKMLPRESKIVALRMPDKPNIADFEAIGRGQDGIEEEKNGVLVLDECASWLNARTWGDVDRQPVLDWFLHSRKLGWDVYLISQHMEQLDKQVRVSFIEFSVRCARLDRLGIPFITSALRVLTLGVVNLRMPKIHMGTVRYGVDRDSLVVQRWLYRGRDLYPCYDTRQVFRDSQMIPIKGHYLVGGMKVPAPPVPIPHVGLHSMLSSWHLYGRHNPRRSLWLDFLKWLKGPQPVARREPAPRLRPLLTLPPDRRWHVARQLVMSGAL